MAASVRETPFAGGLAAGSSAPRWQPSAWQLLLTIWAAVACGIGAWLIIGFVSVRRIVRRATVLTAREWGGALYDLADRLGVERTPLLVRSEDVKMPFAAGLLHPTVVLPAECDRWDDARRRAVLLHELAHISRNDLLGHTLGRVACALYWFHPLVWSAARRLRLESERACDDLALSCGVRPSSYAEHLLDIVTSVREPLTPVVAIPMADRREFEGRMLAILDPDVRRQGSRRQSMTVVAGLAALALVVGGSAPAAARAASADPTLRRPPDATRASRGRPLPRSRPGAGRTRSEAFASPVPLCLRRDAGRCRVGRGGAARPVQAAGHAPGAGRQRRACGTPHAGPAFRHQREHPPHRRMGAGALRGTRRRHHGARPGAAW
jgi:beta-lactamase regulating signal transducer with metallopeptidase domain